MKWPSLDELMRHAPIPDGVSLRLWADAELDGLPDLVRRWYPAATVGAESVFLDPAFLHAELVTVERPDRDIISWAICEHGEVVGFQSFQRDVGARSLHGRLGFLSPEARSGFLGALGFSLFEALGRLSGAELLQVWVTLAFKGQQLFAERRGFTLAGLVPGFDRDLMPDGSIKRVMEALYVKSLVDPAELHWPDDAQLTAKTRAALHALFGG
jgi:hypothetical protein